MEGLRAGEEGRGHQGRMMDPLDEMHVPCQDLGQTLPTHRLYRDAVGQAVTLVEAGLVQREAVQESLP